MSLLEDINLLVLDVNRDIQAMVFFMRMPPRVDTNDKFLDLAKTATTDFRALQAKTVEASEAFPDADTSVMSLELAIEALQAFLVTTIKKTRAALSEWIESQQNLTPGPSLDFLPSITAEMLSLVENVVSSTKSIKKIISGESLAPPQISTSSTFDEQPDIDIHDELAVEILLADPSSTHLDTFLASENPSEQPSADPSPASPEKRVKQGNFDEMLADYEREQRREARRAERRARGEGVRKREVTTRPSIQIDQETIEAIVHHLSNLTAFFFNEANNFGERQGASDTVLMRDMTGNGEIAAKASETALDLQTASIDMESLLNQHHQTSLAKLTSLHMKDIFVAMKEVMSDAPQVKWDSLRTLDVAIKDYANTIKDVVNLTNPEVIEVEEDDEDALVEEELSSSSDEEWIPVKPQRLLTREEEMMIALDGFSDALDALDLGPPSREGSRNDLSPGASSNIPSHRPSIGEMPISKSPAVPNNPLSAPSPLESPRSTAAGDVQKGNNLSSASSSSTSIPRYQDRVTIQFPQVRPRAAASSMSQPPPPPSEKEEKEEKEKKSRPSLVATKSSSAIEQTYEIADEAIRQADPAKVIDRWTGMQARAEERRVVTQDGAIELASESGASSTDWESSKVKAALKFVSKKVDNFRKKASGGSGPNSPGNRDSVRLSQSSGSLFGGGSSSSSSGGGGSSGSPSAGKRRTMMPVSSSGSGANGNGASSSSSSSSSPSLSSNMARRSVQLTGVLPTDKRIFLFEEPEDDNNLRISPETGGVVAGSIEKLVQRLTHDSMPDPDFVLSFLTTHKCFTTSAELLELLCLRWDTAPPPDADPASFESNRLPSIRLRVYNVLKTWMEKFWNDLNEPNMIDRLKVFTAAMYHGGLSSASQTLSKILQKNLSNEGPALAQTLPEPPAVFDFVRRSRREPPIIVPNPPNLPAPVVLHLSPIPSLQSPKLSRPLTILDFHPTELARQVSFMEFELWKQVKNIELLETAWTKKDKETRAPNVLNMIRFSNHISNWLISEILTPDDPFERSAALNRCLWMVKALIEFRNFNGAMECLSAFHSSPVYRLKSTWNLLPASSWAIYDSLEKLMSPDANFKTYRSEYDRSVPPYTPYLGTHLSDLLFLDEKLPRFIEGTTLINYAKMEKMAQFIQTLELSQQMPYSFTPVPLIASYIKDYVTLSEKDAYNRSLQVEARKQKARPNSTAFTRQTVESSPNSTSLSDASSSRESPPSSSSSGGH